MREVTHARTAGETLLVAFLGSNIGNFDPPEAAALLQDIRGAMERGDTLLIGADLVKPAEQLQAAYDDPLGVTAAFNCNLLVRLNRELGADFDLEHFAHDARWNSRAQRMEMHLVSLAQQRVHVPGAKLVLDFHAGETIWTESSYKYESPPRSARRCGRRASAPIASWQDRGRRLPAHARRGALRCARPLTWTAARWSGSGARRAMPAPRRRRGPPPPAPRPPARTCRRRARSRRRAALPPSAPAGRSRQRP